MDTQDNCSAVVCVSYDASAVALCRGLGFVEMGVDELPMAPDQKALVEALGKAWSVQFGGLRTFVRFDQKCFTTDKVYSGVIDYLSSRLQNGVVIVFKVDGTSRPQMRVVMGKPHTQ